MLLLCSFHLLVLVPLPTSSSPLHLHVAALARPPCVHFRVAYLCWSLHVYLLLAPRPGHYMFGLISRPSTNLTSGSILKRCRFLRGHPFCVVVVLLSTSLRLAIACFVVIFAALVQHLCRCDVAPLRCCAGLHQSYVLPPAWLPWTVQSFPQSLPLVRGCLEGGDFQGFIHSAMAICMYIHR